MGTVILAPQYLQITVLPAAAALTTWTFPHLHVKRMVFGGGATWDAGRLSTLRQKRPSMISSPSFRGLVSAFCPLMITPL